MKNELLKYLNSRVSKVRDANDIFYMCKEYCIERDIIIGGSFLSTADNASFRLTNKQRFNITLDEISQFGRKQKLERILNEN